MHVYASVSTAFFVSMSILIVAGSKGRALADSSCVQQPGRDARYGEHWYFHFDREKNRKCWHRGPTTAAAQEAPLPRAERTHTLAATLNSVFSPLFKEFRHIFRRPMPHEAVAGEPRIIQSDANQPLTIEDIAQPQPDLPEERAEVRPATPLTLTQRRALYEEYLKWEGAQRSRGSDLALRPPVQPR
jgi:hypothetical protein